MSSRSSNQPFSHHRKSSRASLTSNTSLGEVDANGFGSLADELGEVWEEDGVEGQDSIFPEGPGEGSMEPRLASRGRGSSGGLSDIHDFGLGMEVYQHPPVANSSILSPHPHSQSRTDGKSKGNQRRDSPHDASDYGPESDSEDLADIPPSLAKRIRDIEKVTRMSINTEDTLSDDGGVIKRTTTALRDLGPQSSIENGATQLITAYTSMATSRTHKTRELFGQAHSLLYGNLLNLPEEMIDVLLCEMEELANTTCVDPPQNPLLSLQILSSNTTDLVRSLRSLTDLLQESRIACTAASRKLKSTREMVEEMRLEEELSDTSIMLIQAGDWDRRCRERQSARMCREVVTGFMKTCDLARDRWIRSLEFEERKRREQMAREVEVL